MTSEHDWTEGASADDVYDEISGVGQPDAGDYGAWVALAREAMSSRYESPEDILPDAHLPTSAERDAVAALLALGRAQMNAPCNDRVARVAAHAAAIDALSSGSLTADAVADAVDVRGLPSAMVSEVSGLIAAAESVAPDRDGAIALLRADSERIGAAMRAAQAEGDHRDHGALRRAMSAPSRGGPIAAKTLKLPHFHAMVLEVCRVSEQGTRRRQAQAVIAREIDYGIEGLRAAIGGLTGRRGRRGLRRRRRSDEIGDDE